MVLAADSATTIIQRHPNGSERVITVYNNANKVFNLHKGLPVGAITWGSGSIGDASISTIVKDFRNRITYQEEHKINPTTYTVEEIAEKFYKFIYEELYQKAFSEWPDNMKPSLGFVIGGYSSNQQHAEEWRIEIKNGKCDGPILQSDLKQTGVSWNGQPEAISRLVKGYDPDLRNILKMANLDDMKIQEIIELCNKNLTAPIIIPAMPIQDAIDIAHFLIDLTAKYVKYTPGAPTVGGPIEIAAITKHEGFKWVKRKHYYDIKLNPKEMIFSGETYREHSPMGEF